MRTPMRKPPVTGQRLSRLVTWDIDNTKVKRRALVSQRRAGAGLVPIWYAAASVVLHCARRARFRPGDPTVPQRGGHPCVEAQQFQW